MNRFFLKAKEFVTRGYYKAEDFFPTALPTGLTTFNEWCDRLFFTYFPPGVSAPDEASFRFSLAGMILHLDHTKAKVPNRFFGKAIHKGAANEVASYVMRDLKEKRDALIEAQQQALKLKAQAEATAPTAVAPDEPAR